MPLPYRLFYRRRRPTRWGKLLNGAWAWLFSLGILPASLVALETQGRRSGQPRVNALVAGEYEGERYLVSMLGDHVDWLRNVRAAGGEAFIRRRGRRRVRLEEVPVEGRAPILQAYYRQASGARPHFDVPAQPALEDFERVAARHPVFRIAQRET
ncbi:MAG: hypothetical protein A2148_07055 [Chloroflexi bacterium RBG_16_68_14]|nr:MAG: hypothetical protein A2148_07055 [Chloroflexi bacterium RBG_16_68_14]